MSRPSMPPAHAKAETAPRRAADAEWSWRGTRGVPSRKANGHPKVYPVRSCGRAKADHSRVWLTLGAQAADRSAFFLAHALRRVLEALASQKYERAATLSGAPWPGGTPPWDDPRTRASYRCSARAHACRT